MSAYIVDDAHIRYLIAYAYQRAHGRDYGVESTAARETTALMLINANIASVDYRYEQETPPRTDFPMSDWECASTRTEPVQVLKAISCLDYQSCERPDWEGSPAQEWLEQLTWTAIHDLPGYEDAAWGIDDTDGLAVPTEPGAVSR